MPSVSLTAPTDYALETQKLDRQRKLAEALQAQSMEPTPAGQMAGQFFVPTSPLTHLAKILNARNARVQMDDADERAKALAAQMRGDRQKTVQEAMTAMQGRPEGWAGDAVGDWPVHTPAVPANPQAAYGILAGSSDPGLQAAGMGGLMKSLEPVKLRQGEGLYSPTGQPIMTNQKPPEGFSLQPGGTRYNPDGTPLVAAPAAPRVMSPGQTLLGPDNQPITTMPDKPDELTAAITAAGLDPKSPEAQALFRQRAAKLTTHQPAPQIRIDNKMGEGVAKEVGPMIAEQRGQALAALDQAGAADRILGALDSGKVQAGPTATVRLFGDQLAQMLGVGGETTTERLQNTRQAIKGLAQLTLNSRKQMRGQGAVTESEGLLAQKAESGDIDSLTLPEIRTLALASRKAAQERHQQYRTQLGNMRGDKNLQNLVPFFDVPEWPSGPQTPVLSPTAQQYLDRARGGGQQP